MKIYASSDIHIDSHEQNFRWWTELYKYCLANPPDILIIAGDLAETLNSWDKALQLFKECQFDCLIVPGNHDLWCRNENLNSEDKLNLALPEICAKYGWIYLPDGSVKIDNWIFVGSPAWYDYSLMPADHPFTLDDFMSYQRDGRRWMDGIYCKWKQFQSPNRDFQLTDYFYNKLEKQLKEATTDNIFLVTHFPFYTEFLNFTGTNWNYEYFGAFMGSKKYRELLYKYPIKKHICGHLHRFARTKVADCDAYLSPVGYVKEWDGMQVKERLSTCLLIIEV
tara:strand:- start:3055 stop:3894 length:840 start_codon:yes stop_codon:yes gene_type:complete